MSESSTSAIDKVRHKLKEIISNHDDVVGVEYLYDVLDLIKEENVEPLNKHRELYKILKRHTKDIACELLIDESIFKEKLESFSLTPLEMSRAILYLNRGGEV